MKVETALTTAPNMMPTMGTMRDERSVTRRRKRKKIRVPAKANTIATIMRTMTEGIGSAM